MHHLKSAYVRVKRATVTLHETQTHKTADWAVILVATLEMVKLGLVFAGLGALSYFIWLILVD